jgi:type IV pilus assembly protein PilY1
MLWDSARVVQSTLDSLKSATNYLNRRLYTLQPSGAVSTSVQGSRVEVNSTYAMGVVLPDSWFSAQSLGYYPYDLNRDQRGLQPATTADRDFMRDWLYGWEDRQGVANTLCNAAGECKRQGSPSAPVMRAWSFGGVQLGSPAIVTAPSTPSWFNFVTPAEASAFTVNFAEPLRQRETVAFVGTLGGYLHAFNTGKYTRGDDPCTGPSPRGYFERTPCSGTRNYGDGKELFAYLPNSLLRNYVRNYIGQLPGVAQVPPAQVNAPPSFGDVDFGRPDNKVWTVDKDGTPNRGAKTVLVSATGPLTDIVMALDVTDPSKKDETDSRHI